MALTPEAKAAAQRAAAAAPPLTADQIETLGRIAMRAGPPPVKPQEWEAGCVVDLAASPETAVEPVLMTAAQAAEYLGVAESAVRRWTRLSQMPVTRIGVRTFYRAADLDAWLDAKTEQPEPATRKLPAVERVKARRTDTGRAGRRLTMPPKAPPR